MNTRYSYADIRASARRHGLIFAGGFVLIAIVAAYFAIFGHVLAARLVQSVVFGICVNRVIYCYGDYRINREAK